MIVHTKMKAQKTVKNLKVKNLKIALAESITGGLIAKTITDVPGASRVFEYGWVAYSNQAKNKILGVPLKTLEKYGSVSKETTSSMVRGAKNKSGADITVAVTGFAGPEAPKKSDRGKVFIAVLTDKHLKIVEKKFKGNREEIRTQTCDTALSLIDEVIRGGKNGRKIK